MMKNLNAVTGCLKAAVPFWSAVAGWLQAQT